MIFEGAVLCGRYVIIHPIGRGGMATVWAATQLSTGRHVAVKILVPDDGDPTASERFCAEARIVALIRSRYVVDVLDYGVDPALGPFIVMELLVGESLRERIRKQGPVGLSHAVEVISQVTYGLEQAHRAGIVHRDIKPDNLVLVPGEDEHEVAKLVDFGLAKAPVFERQLTADGYLVGTLEYMSPEQVRGNPVDARSDLWSLALVFFEALTGRRVFAATSAFEVVEQIRAALVPVPSHFSPSVPKVIDQWFLQATQCDPEDRFQSATAFRNALQSASSDCEADPAPSEPEPPVSRYYVSDGLAVVGPLRASLVVRGVEGGRIDGDHWVWRDTWSDWRTVAETPELSLVERVEKK